jgi:hypothetical protein
MKYMMNRKNRYFLTEVYNGSDRDDFQKDFVEYLKEILKTRRWEAMSEHTLFLQGAKTAIEEIVEELYQEPEEIEEIPQFKGTLQQLNDLTLEKGGRGV